MVEEDLDLTWEIQGNRVDTALRMDDEFYELLERSGMKKLHFGVESGSPRILKLIKKYIEPSKVLELNRRLRDFNFHVQYNFMCGFPTETVEDLRMSLELALRLMEENPRASISGFYPYTPYPGTEDFDTHFGHLLHERKNLEDWIDTDFGQNPWLSASEQKFIRSVFFCSLFLDSQRPKDLLDSALLRKLHALYRPVALFRLRHFFFHLMPELPLKDLFMAVRKPFSP